MGNAVKTQTILVADDDASIRFVLEAALTQAGYKTKMAKDGRELLAMAESGLGDAIITDVAMPELGGFEAMRELRESRPGLPVIVISARPPLATAVQANQAGAFEFLSKPFDLYALMDTLSRCLAALPTALPDGTQLPAPANDAPLKLQDGLLTGQSSAMQELYRTIARVIDLDLTVLISGESGSGKARVARTLHDLSRRAKAPFVAQSLAALTKETIVRELFGPQGALERAEGGTLFLDEIGDLPLDAQAQLLQLLQESESHANSGKDKAPVRVIAATQRDLRALVAAGLFREDLYYRLQVIPIRMPSLRERVMDIPVLVSHFLESAPSRGLSAKRITPSALARLAQHSWPGNVRELEHCIWRLCALVAEPEISATHVEAELASLARPARMEAAQVTTEGGATSGLDAAMRAETQALLTQHAENEASTELYDQLLQSMERPLLEVVMRHARNNQLRAARILGVNRNTLRKMLKRYEMIG